MRKWYSVFVISLAAVLTAGPTGCKANGDSAVLKRLLLDLKEVLKEDYREEFKSFP